MKRKKYWGLFIVCVWLFCLTDFCNAEVFHEQTIVSSTESGEVRNTPPMIRAAYFHLTSPEQGEEQLQRLHVNGFNTALVADGAYQLKEDLWQAWGTIAAQYDSQLIPVLHFAVPRDLQGSYRPYTNRAGVVQQATPCPVDKDYWDMVIGKRFERFAELSKTVPLAGAVFDAEMYGSEISLYYDLCYCDFCWQEFISSESSLMPSADGIHQNLQNLPGEKRFDSLEKHQLFRQYTNFQFNQVRELLSHIESRVHRINPAFHLGFLGYRHIWFFIALVQGLGTTENPVLVFSESSYVRGYTPYVDLERERVVGNSSRARYIPGLWLGRFFPGDISAQLTDLAINTDGYWIYTADSLWTDESKSGDRVLHGSSHEYWRQIKQANSELSRLAQDSDSIHRTIAPVYQSSFYDSSQNRLITAPALQQLLTRLSLSKRDLLPKPASDDRPLRSEKILFREKTLFHSFKQQKEKASIQITHVPLGQDEAPIHYQLFDNEGTLIQEGDITYHEGSTSITLSAEMSGRISLLTDSGIHAAQVSFQGLPYLIEASSTYPLATIRSIHNYALYVKPGQRWLKLRAYCPEREFASLSILSSEASVHQSLDILGALYGFFEMRVAVSHEAGLQQAPGKGREAFSDHRNFWIVAVTPLPSQPFANLRFYLYNQEFPYLWSIDE